MYSGCTSDLFYASNHKHSNFTHMLNWAHSQQFCLPLEEVAHAGAFLSTQIPPCTELKRNLFLFPTCLFLDVGPFPCLCLSAGLCLSLHFDPVDLCPCLDHRLSCYDPGIPACPCHPGQSHPGQSKDGRPTDTCRHDLETHDVCLGADHHGQASPCLLLLLPCHPCCLPCLSREAESSPLWWPSLAQPSPALGSPWRSGGFPSHCSCRVPSPALSPSPAPRSSEAAKQSTTRVTLIHGTKHYKSHINPRNKALQESH